MKRVTSFELYNHTIEVLYQEEVWHEGKKVFGLCDMQKCVLQVATHSPYDGTPLSESVIHHNFNHEKAHAKMSFVDEKFYLNETKIDRLGALDAQYEKTAKYD